MNDCNNYFEVIMGLDVYVRRVNKNEVKAVEVYAKTNWPKVQSGEMNQTNYWNSFPYIKQCDGIRKFGSLFDYLKTLTGKDGDVFILNHDQVKQCKSDALAYAIGGGNDFCYTIATVCDKFFKKCKASDMMQVVFDY